MACGVLSARLCAVLSSSGAETFMAHSSQTALLDLIESYLQDLRHEAETLSTVARLINQSIESRRQIMGELAAYFAGSQFHGVAVPGRSGQPADMQGGAAWPDQSRDAQGGNGADRLLRDLDSMIGQAPAQSRSWPSSYHS
jgi:hypothetical protein